MQKYHVWGKKGCFGYNYQNYGRKLQYIWYMRILRHVDWLLLSLAWPQGTRDGHVDAKYET